MRHLVFIAFLSVMCLNAQKRVEVDLTFEYNDDLTYYENILIGQLELRKFTSLESLEEGYLPLSGFQYVRWFDHSAPVHLEEDDSFIIVLGQNYNEYEYYYTGDKGAIKNNYLLSRHRELKALESDSVFVNAAHEKTQSTIQRKKDSLLRVANSLSLSEQFLKDEQQFWKYYSTYHDVFYKLLRSKNIDFTSLKIDDFPKMDYDVEKDHFNYRRYLDLSVAYYFVKISQLDSYEEMRDVIKDIDSKILKRTLSQAFVDQVLKREARSEVYFKLADRFSNSPTHFRLAKKVFNKRNRLQIGDPFPSPKVFDFYDKKIELEKAKGKSAYIFIYAANDKNLESNFLKWNQFYVEQKSDISRFITIGLFTDQNVNTFKNFFLKYQVAGSHLTTSNRQSEKLIYNLGSAYGPFIVHVDENWNILDFNVSDIFDSYNIFSRIPSAVSWKPELGKY